MNTIENAFKILEKRSDFSDEETIAFVVIRDEYRRLQSQKKALISDVLCLCCEGPDVMRPGEIYKALIKSAEEKII